MRKSRRKLKNTSRQTIMKNTLSKSMGGHKSSAQWKVHSNTGFSQKRRSQINNLTHHLNELEKEEQTKPKVSRRKEIIKIKEEINKIEIKKIEKINKTKSWFFKKVNKIDKLLARLTQKRREKTQLNKIRNEKEVTMDTTEIRKTIREYYEQLYANKFDNLEEVDNFLES